LFSINTENILYCINTLSILSDNFDYWVEHINNIVVILIKIIYVYMIHIWNINYLWLKNFFTLNYCILTIIENIQFKLLTLVDWWVYFYYSIYNTYIVNITYFFCNVFQFSWFINQIINYIFPLIFYIKMKFYIKFWIFSRIIIKILKKKLISKFLSYLTIKKVANLMQTSSTILIDKKTASIFKYFILINFIFISYLSPFPLTEDFYFLYLIIFTFIRYELKNLFFSFSVLSVIPLTTSDVEEDNTNLDSPDNTLGEEEPATQQQEEKIERFKFSNFNNLSPLERQKFVERKIKLKGLTSNIYLVEYFIQAILNKVSSGSQLDVEKYLNKDLDTIVKDNRNIQLNKHSFVRIRPFLLNNSNNSGFPSVVPYKSIESIAEIKLDN